MFLEVGSHPAKITPLKENFMARMAVRSACLTAVLAVVPVAAWAADTGGSAVTPPSSVAAPLTLGGTATTVPTTAPAAGATGAKSLDALLGTARSSIAAKNWTEALATLKQAAVADPKNADVQNLLGYATRNNGDAKGSLAYYDAALVLNPQHTGALEYQGVAYIKLGQTAKAKANLAKLKTICGVSCEQYKDLAAALKAPKKK